VLAHLSLFEERETKSKLGTKPVTKFLHETGDGTKEDKISACEAQK
jgi:hypothetical protein